MAIRERLNEKVSKDIDETLDDLDAAYIEQLREQGIDEELIRQFAAMARIQDSGEDN